MPISKRTFAEKYLECGDVVKAALFAGASPENAERTGLRLLHSRTVRRLLSDMREHSVFCPAVQGLRRLAFGSSNDAVQLAVEGESGEGIFTRLADADLFGVQEIKYKNGQVEIKFFDRIKALEALCAFESDALSEQKAQGLLSAICGREEDEQHWQQ